ncbi:MAG TPA: LytTR family DNA-binding domain-containing protein [Caulobacteraceae bacterium]|jgi:DNA-binding LytR/AlgR family response regulator
MGEVASMTGRIAARPRVQAEPSPAALAALIAQLGLVPRPREYLRWIKALSGDRVDLVPVARVNYFHAEAKYTTVVTDGREAIIRRPIKQLAAELDPDRFWQIHRSTIVNVEAIEAVFRDGAGYRVKLRSQPATLRVSGPYRHLFRHM